MTILVLESPKGTPVDADSERLPIDGDLIRDEKTTGGGKIHSVVRIYDAPPPPQPPHKLVGLDNLETELPDAVLVELETIKNNAGETDAKRAAVTRILNAMARGDKVDVFNGKFSILMTRLANNTNLTAEQATAIVDTLKEL